MIKFIALLLLFGTMTKCCLAWTVNCKSITVPATATASVAEAATHPLCSNKHNHRRLNMGGYYNEPDDDTVTTQNTHMVYGIRCVERIVSLSPTVNVTILLPVDDDEEDEGRRHPAPLTVREETTLASHTSSSDTVAMTSRVAVLEGSGLVSLSLVSMTTQAANFVVLACSVNASSLQRIRMSYLMFSSSSSRGILETGT